MKYTEIQEDLIKRFRIKLDPCSTCWGRMHAHPRERRVCKFHIKNSFRATFDLMHEIGHIEANNATMRRCEQEYHATQWGIDHLADYGLKMDEIILAKYQCYIDEEYDRGIRRHCTTLPPRESLQLKI